MMIDNIIKSTIPVTLKKFNSVAFSALKKEALDGLEHIKINQNLRNHDLIDMFQEKIDREKFFYNIKKHKNLIESEILKDANIYALKNKEHILQKFVNYSKITDFSEIELYIERTWINYQRPGEFIPCHVHSGILSFVVWVSMPNIIKRNIIDHSASKHAAGNFELIYTDVTGDMKTFKICTDKTMEGFILWFPADLIHQVYPFYTDEIRVSFSGNIRVKKKNGN